MSRLRKAKEQAVELFIAVLSNDSDEDKNTAINDANEILAKPFVQKYFDKEMLSVIDFFIDSPCVPFAQYCQNIKFRCEGDSKKIISDYEENEVTLAEQVSHDLSFTCYYLFHPLNGKVKVQRWTTDNGCTSDFVVDTISCAIKEIGAGGLAFVPETRRSQLEELFLESEARYQSNRAAYEARFLAA
ncbi:hypothetical protein [Psychromonas sp. SP041]|uniref:hypothetical protein n=1 Tax=Psychromonas sp. SP041 TaxID=1365007 RepID=UPI0010C7D771|nr:hypothetical protein [Psychromonas sp. SP041]